MISALVLVTLLLTFGLASAVGWSGAAGEAFEQRLAAVPDETCGVVENVVDPSADAAGAITIDGVTTTLPAGTQLPGQTGAELARVAAASASACVVVAGEGEGPLTVSLTSISVCGVLNLDDGGEEVMIGEYPAIFEYWTDTSPFSREERGQVILAGEFGDSACFDMTVDPANGSIQSIDVTATFTAEACSEPFVEEPGSFHIGGLVPDEPFAPGVYQALAAISPQFHSCIDVAVDGDQVDIEITITGCMSVEDVTEATLTVNGSTLPRGPAAAVDLPLGEQGVLLSVDLLGVRGAEVIALEGCGVPAAPRPPPGPDATSRAPVRPDITLPPTNSVMTEAASSSDGPTLAAAVVLLAATAAAVVALRRRSSWHGR